MSSQRSLIIGVVCAVFPIALAYSLLALLPKTDGAWVLTYTLGTVLPVALIFGFLGYSIAKDYRKMFPKSK